METRTLTIIDTGSRLTEVKLDSFGKEKVTMGRSREQCDIVIPDNIVSKLHGTFYLDGEDTWYEDNGSMNGTFAGDGEQRRLLTGGGGCVRLYDKTVLRIGDVHAPDKMILLLYRIVPEGEVWKKASLGQDGISI